jgi:hypothetical protein
VVKQFVLIPKGPDVTDEYFHTYWRTGHAENLALKIRRIDRYTQSHRVAAAVPGWPETPYLGIAECGFASLELAYGLTEDPDYTENVQYDDATFMDGERVGFITCGEPLVLRAGAPIAKDTPGVKVILLLARSIELSPAEFRERVTALGSELAAAGDAHTVLLCPAELETYDMELKPPYDAILELYYPDADTYSRAWEQSGGALLETLGPIVDAARTSASLYEELRFRWPTAAELEAV